MLAFAASAQVVEGRLHYQSGDTLLLTDSRGYLYSLMHTADGDALGVAPGGNYVGEVVVPEAVSYNGVTYPVTAIRRFAMMRDPSSPEAKLLKKVTLPKSVTIVGTDAFSGNTELNRLVYGRDDLLVETRAFMNCRNLSHYYMPALFCYTKPSENKSDRQYFVYPIEKQVDIDGLYQWAFFKNRHNGIKYLGMSNLDNEDAMACYCSNPDRVRCANFQLRNPSSVNAMFSGYSYGQNVVLLSNDYVGFHDFPSFSRWTFGEDFVDMSQYFVDQMEKVYKRKVRYAYQAAKVSSDGREQQVAITEFEITNHEAMVVLSWVVDGDVECSWVETQEVRSDYNPNEGTLWNVDDDGSYGIPEILLIALDSNGNVDIFFNHGAPESLNFYHLMQKGNVLTVEKNEQYYVLYE